MSGAVHGREPDMMGELLGYLHNLFICDRRQGCFTIAGAQLELSGFVQVGQYYLISGSVMNDGVYKNSRGVQLRDETFVGEVCALAVPAELRSLEHDIAAWCADPANRPGAYTSESFGGYSYTRAVGENGQPASWQDVFAARLRRWRKL